MAIFYIAIFIVCNYSDPLKQEVQKSTNFKHKFLYFIVLKQSILIYNLPKQTLDFHQ
jgi:hypothetical protein